MTGKWNFALTAVLVGGLLAMLVGGCGDKPEAEKVPEREPEKAMGPMLGEVKHKDLPVGDIVAMAKESAAAGSVTNSAVKAEVWTKDFPTAMAKAMAEHRPLIITAGSTTCGSCKKMEKSLDDLAFQHWLKGSGIYLVRAHVDADPKDAMQAMARKFLNSLPAKTRIAIPHAGLFWPRENGEPVMAHFSYARGQMPGDRNPVQVGEFISAMDKALADYFKGQKRPSWDEIVQASKKKIAVAKEGDGEVKMKPDSGEMPCGKEVRLTATPARGSQVMGWKGPDGKWIKDKRDRNNRTKNLVLQYTADAGTYTVVFGK